MTSFQPLTPTRSTYAARLCAGHTFNAFGNTVKVVKVVACKLNTVRVHVLHTNGVKDSYTFNRFDSVTLEGH